VGISEAGDHCISLQVNTKKCSSLAHFLSRFVSENGLQLLICFQAEVQRTRVERDKVVLGAKNLWGGESGLRKEVDWAEKFESAFCCARLDAKAEQLVRIYGGRRRR